MDGADLVISKKVAKYLKINKKKVYQLIVELLELNFIPINGEGFDLVFFKKGVYRKSIKALFALLDPLNINLFPKNFPGYDFKHRGKIIFESYSHEG